MRSDVTCMELHEYTTLIDEACTRGDYALAARLIEDNPAAAWLGIPPDRMHAILTATVAAVEATGEPRYTLRVLTGFTGGELPTVDDLADAPDGQRALARKLLRAGRVVDLRLRGRTDELAAAMAACDEELAGSRNISRMRDGWDLIICVQCGMAAMQLGDFPRALAYFTRAQLHPFVPTLALLTRDAYVKSALIHGAFGDPADARTALAQADGIRTTGSWMEPGVEAHAAIASALVDIEDPRSAAAVLDAIPMHHIGEMWPFYVMAIRRVLDPSRRITDLTQRIAMIEQLPLARQPGIGFTGSLFPAVHAGLMLAAGDDEAAKELLAGTDPSYIATQAYRVLIALRAGDGDGALERAEALRRNPFSAGLRRVELWFHAGVATAHLLRKDTAAAVESLRDATLLPGGLTRVDLRYFTAELQTLAAARIAEWPTFAAPAIGALPEDESRDGEAVPSRALELARTATLTRREREVLQLLRQGLSRSAITDQLFVSVNTLKSHQRAIYRKLGVNSRAAAIRAVEGDGWL